MSSDPFESLEPEWARDVERRAVRAARVQRVRRGLRPPRRRGLGPTGKLLLIGVVAAAAVLVSFGASYFLPGGP
ncbi:hypothetical protein ABT369_34360 [Dactylosporangium sp. NPDC000244]|uniref:hypothetical protein n=1 Tax=Dactylosporangium sp. NPDC000244 TaxID=3154365 RepID=UPI00332D07C3